MPLRGLLNKRKEMPSANRPDAESLAEESSPDASTAPQKSHVRARVAAWIDTLQRDPSAEERVAAERRALLLEELNRTVADAPDDVPIKYVIERLNRHWDD